MRYLLLIFALALPAKAFDPAQPIQTYLQKPEKSFAWRETARGENDGPISLEMTSQTWRGQNWKHKLTVFRPKKQECPGVALISLQTNPTPFDGFAGQLSANAVGAPFIGLYDIPNQPFWGKKEDELLAYSLEKAYETKDLSWPLVFPMAKSVTQAMTAISQWSQKEKGRKIEKFILVGASKRGWAAWLAAGDKRVAGLVCIGYNNLNIPKQVPNQKAQWGELSPLFKSYTQRGLWQKMQTPEGAKIMQAVDPWALRNQITCPKFVIDSTNNGFWTLDAFDQYAPGLKGQTSFLMLPNAGHYMENSIPQLFGSIAAWSRRVLGERKLPHGVSIQIVKMADGRVVSTAGLPSLVLDGSEGGAQKPTIWLAFSESRDFRRAVWQEAETTGGIASLEVYYSLTVSIPADKPFVAVFGQAVFPGKSQPLTLSSPVITWDSGQAVTNQIKRVGPYYPKQDAPKSSPLGVLHPQ